VRRAERGPRAVEPSEVNGGDAYLSRAFGEPPPYTILASQALHHTKTRRDVGRNRGRVGEALLLLGRPPIVRGPVDGKILTLIGPGTYGGDVMVGTAVDLETAGEGEEPQAVTKAARATAQPPLRKPFGIHIRTFLTGSKGEARA